MLLKNIYIFSWSSTVNIDFPLCTNSLVFLLLPPLDDFHLCIFMAYDMYLMMFQASPVAIGGRNAVVEEKRSTNSKGKLFHYFEKCMFSYLSHVVEDVKQTHAIRLHVAVWVCQMNWLMGRKGFGSEQATMGQMGRFTC